MALNSLSVNCNWMCFRCFVHKWLDSRCDKAVNCRSLLAETLTNQCVNPLISTLRPYVHRYSLTCLCRGRSVSGFTPYLCIVLLITIIYTKLIQNIKKLYKKLRINKLNLIISWLLTCSSPSQANKRVHIFNNLRGFVETAVYFSKWPVVTFHLGDPESPIEPSIAGSRYVKIPGEGRKMRGARIPAS